jgi:phospho-N-acetylmuramoyl-pentapeptide-transferase
MTIKLISAFALAFLFATAFGRFYIPWLRKQKAGQQIKEIGPKWHMTKSGTPTMGGVMFILAVTFVCLTLGFEGMLHGNYAHIFVLLFALVFGAIGFLDDWEKIKKKQNLGLSGKMKFLLQLAAALVFVLLMRQIGFLKTQLYIPFWQKTVQVPEWLYYIFAAFVIVGTVNAVNLTDGLDGLASGTSLPVCLFFVAVTFLWGERYLELGLFASALAGGLVGFLVYNFHPAKVFMGDTGSLFLGGAVAALAFAFDMPMILITLGIMYIVETLSDIIQVGYFKLSHGKRVFRMAPFHHHLEMGGWTGKKWKEVEIFCLFSGISLLFAIISFIGVFHRAL